MINKLKQMKIKAMKERDVISKNILSVLHSDALELAKKENRDVCDSDIIKASKSLIKKNEQTLELIKNSKTLPITIDKMEQEVKILKKFLPVQMTEDEIKIAIYEIMLKMNERDLIRKNQGIIMKQLKEEFGDTINMSVASKYVSSKLS